MASEKEFVKRNHGVAEEQGEPGEDAGTSGLGNVNCTQGDLNQAIEFEYRLSLFAAIILEDKEEESKAYENLGNHFWRVGDFMQALSFHLQHLVITKILGDRAGELSAFGNLGIVYTNLGYLKRAAECHLESLSIAEELKNKNGEGAAYANLGIVLLYLGDFILSKEYFTQHLSIAKEIGDKVGEGTAYGNLGNACLCLNDFEKALDYHKQDLSIAKELGNKAGEGGAYGNLGIAYEGLGDFKQAIEYHMKHYHIAKELGDKHGEAKAYGNLGNAHFSLGNVKKAIEYHTQRRNIAKELGDKIGEGKACFRLGCDHANLGALHDAADYFKASVKQLNDVRAHLESIDVWKITFRTICQDAYDALWRILIRLEQTDEALLVAEQGRAQALLDLMKFTYDSELPVSGLLEPGVTIPGILSISSTQTVLVAFEGNKVYFWVLHEGKNVQFRQHEVTDQDAVTFLKRLRRDVFKEYQISDRVKCENRSLDELRKKAPPNNTEFEHEIINTPFYETSSLRQFYDCVIDPIADLLEGDELVIVPDGPLSLAPYAAFLDPKSRYLSESVRIRMAPSLTSLKLIADCPADYHKTSGALLVGDPCVEEVTNELGTPTLSPLPYARKEVKMIGEMLDISPLVGKEATKDEVLRQIESVAVIHIAAHGNMKSGEIALAPNPARTSKIPAENDYILKMSDLRDVQLRARLVVLSCCHSAQGTVNPEGVVGIARAFLGAGARSVLVSLWAIDDEATMEFMKHFYRHLSYGHRASAALTWAMKCLRESERFFAVKYWAPFVLIGDDVSIKF